jgi:protein TonB
VLKGIGGGCDEEALRVVSGMPRWTPGMQKGKPVRVQFNLPIKFTIENSRKNK